MSNEIDIKGIDKAELLAGLYNRSKPLVLGFLQASPNDMTVEQAEAIIKSGQTRFDYLHGRVMKIDISQDTLNPAGYDRDLGQGACKSVVDAIRANAPTPKNEASFSGELEGTIARAKPTTTLVLGRNVTMNLGIDDKLVKALEERRPVFRPNSTPNKKPDDNM